MDSFVVACLFEWGKKCLYLTITWELKAYLSLLSQPLPWSWWRCRVSAASIHYGSCFTEWYLCSNLVKLFAEGPSGILRVSAFLWKISKRFINLWNNWIFSIVSWLKWSTYFSKCCSKFIFQYNLENDYQLWPLCLFTRTIDILFRFILNSILRYYTI